MGRSSVVPCRSMAVEQIRHGLELTQKLQIASILWGEPHTGKRTLVYELFPELPTISGRDEKGLLATLEREQALIITEFEAVHRPSELDFQNKRIIAIADQSIEAALLDEKFAFIYRMPPLRERPEDLEVLTRHFAEEARRDLMLSEAIAPREAYLDLTENLRSLRASIYRDMLLQSLDAEELERALEHHFDTNLEGNNAYRENLGLLERPLLRAGLRKYGSQLKLAEALGINRNTLRKKLHEHRID
ncbi:helix-turn-helix domain-containing protein [Nitratifractor salsuginis]|uniref:Transcriptional regulator, Fis family n=1 Tax=Nitratifractor salsuginis (strain DSM 16511 / JCM 12458 / E9I37-1) TaxID=749222 RepID=E6WYX4_NITSE|nr:helix-turn-helix domain-containing protein [Nitratifractor salsuginis]ADV46560.1 transcriptional regulator, Fis family [Nitratifractor salsuginis DSM 16511]